ncbi:hypothetical protein CPB85DRAFT_1263401 [Mucidula mucida]|nr:hypothetical protein CPB85DRAFT_1263401 [Mucidula mucida]
MFTTRTLLDAVHRYDACCLRVLDLGLDLSSIDDLDVTAVGGLGALGGALPVDLFRPFKRPAFDLTIVSLHRRPSSYPYCSLFKASEFSGLPFLASPSVHFSVQSADYIRGIFSPSPSRTLSTSSRSIAVNDRRLSFSMSSPLDIATSSFAAVYLLSTLTCLLALPFTATARNISGLRVVVVFRFAGAESGRPLDVLEPIGCDSCVSPTANKNFRLSRQSEQGRLDLADSKSSLLAATMSLDVGWKMVDEASALRLGGSPPGRRRRVVRVHGDGVELVAWIRARDGLGRSERLRSSTSSLSMYPRQEMGQDGLSSTLSSSWA